MKTMFITDKEVATAMGVSVSTVCRALKSGRTVNGGVDLRAANPIKVCSTRRWNVTKLASILGITPEELMSSIR